MNNAQNSDTETGRLKSRPNDYSQSEGNIQFGPDSELSLDKRISLERHWFGLLALANEKMSTGFDYKEIPTTTEGKIAYNEKIMELKQNPVIQQSGISMPLLNVPTTYNSANTKWSINSGAEALAGHEVLELFDYGNASGKLLDGASPVLGADGMTDANGFEINLPARYREDGSFVSYSHSDPGRPNEMSEPQIKFEDSVGLSGMSIDERQTFLSRVQNILNKVSPGTKAIFYKYDVAKDKNGQDILKIEGTMGFVPGSGIVDAIRDSVQQELNKDKTLVDMLSKAQASSNQTRDELTISVVDKSGNRLAKNEIILSANGKSLKTTVNTIKDLDYKGILKLIG
ncbi:MAG: hypothetical protein LBH59_09795 [Planctomycetaceae bacterium]|nr:hypothetical protein [Planctomycetaceae bacterium]